MGVFWTNLLELLSPRHLLTILRVLVAVIKFLPVPLIIILMSPTFLIWFVLPDAKQNNVLKLIQKLILWTRATRE